MGGGEGWTRGFPRLSDDPMQDAQAEITRLRGKCNRLIRTLEDDWTMETLPLSPGDLDEEPHDTPKEPERC